MPLAPPVLDDRRFGQLVDETLARARVHTPEWTNFNQGDPGVTLVQLFSFLTENLLYRTNLIPERNRVKFLQLLRVPLAAATPARHGGRGAFPRSLIARPPSVRALEWLSRSMIAVEAPGWRGATKAHTAGM